MKLSLKELIAKACRPASVTSVSLPFTPPSNGLLIVVLRAQATGRSYAIFSNASPGIADGYTAQDSYYNATLFVTKGKTVSISESANIRSDQQYWFIPLVGGGTA